MDHCTVIYESICTTTIAKPQNVIKENVPCIVPWEYT